MKKIKILLIVSISIISLGVACLVAGIILSLLGYILVSDILLGTSSVLGIAAVAFLVWRLTLMPSAPAPVRRERPTVYVKTVDVKEIPKTKEEKLFEQYEDLYKRNLISKEDLDKKRAELLGK